MSNTDDTDSFEHTTEQDEEHEEWTLGGYDVYTLEMEPDGYEDVTQWASGRLEIDQTPEQRDEFLDWMEDLLVEAGRILLTADEVEA